MMELPKSLQAVWLSGVAAAVAICLAGIPSANAGSAFDSTAAKESVVRIIAHFKDGIAYGSGMIINEKHQVVTNNHVVTWFHDKEQTVEVASSVEVGFLTVDGPKLVKANLITRSELHDFAVIEATSELLGEPVVFATADPDDASEVKAIGYPGAADIVSDPKHYDDAFFIPSLTYGKVSRMVPQDPLHGNIKVVQHTAFINHGNSGGPLFDACQQVVGINTFLPSEEQHSQGIFFSIHASEIVKFLKEEVIAFSQRDSRCDPTVAPAKDTSVSEADGERAAYARMVSCAQVYPCDQATCLRHYQSHTEELTRATRKGDIDSLVASATLQCGRNREELAYDALYVCADKIAACDYPTSCEAPYTKAVPEEFAKPRQAALERTRKEMADTCSKSKSGGGQQSNKGQTEPNPQPNPQPNPTPHGNPQPQGSGTAAVTPRTYHANLKFDRSGAQSHAEEILRGNCSDQTVRLEVNSSFAITFEYHEGTRWSVWRGRVDPQNGDVAVVSSDVRVFRKSDNAALETPTDTSIAGSFGSGPDVSFAPCGKGRLLVNN